MADRPRCVDRHAVRVCSSNSASAATTTWADCSCAFALHSDGILHQRHDSIWRSRLSRYRGGRPGSVPAWHRHSHHGSGIVRRNVPCSRHWRAGSKTACGSVYPRLRGGAPIWAPIRSRRGDSSPTVTARLHSFECSVAQRVSVTMRVRFQLPDDRSGAVRMGSADRAGPAKRGSAARAADATVRSAWQSRRGAGLCARTVRGRPPG